MEPNEFIAEIYRRMGQKNESTPDLQGETDILTDKYIVRQAIFQYKPILPTYKDSAILDIGCGNGWFIKACINLGYTNIHAADFFIDTKEYIKEFSPHIINFYNIKNNIGDLLAKYPNKFDFIHLSHVIEHIPKYSLLYIMDSIYQALKINGTVLIRTPNMEGPCPHSSLFVTLGHEYGFTGSNLKSLLTICNFDDIQFHQFNIYHPSIKQRFGRIIRHLIIKWHRFKHRLFGVNYGGQFGQELIVSAKRRCQPPLFNNKFR
jgi:2-polyprenyl-3-methyl-5-hydroxy-6-metoxy-1,4-benzoquinol methylase